MSSVRQVVLNRFHTDTDGSFRLALLKLFANAYRENICYRGVAHSLGLSIKVVKLLHKVFNDSAELWNTHRLPGQPELPTVPKLIRERSISEENKIAMLEGVFTLEEFLGVAPTDEPDGIYNLACDVRTYVGDMSGVSDNFVEEE